ncbi:MAG: DNA repair protein RadA [Gammaproteobacteria bacterium]|nr:DNA repair protein RadA [Gammaproteobacteria bacterium]
MSKQKIIYSCTECGAEASKWAGQCFDCGGWNTMVEAISEPKKTGRHKNFSEKAMALKTWSMSEVETGEKARSSTGISELDRVLGGGLVQGSVVLIGGDPGIGKSTLLLQGMVKLCKQTSALYVTGEESLQQVTMRAQRMDLAVPELRLVAETSVERILEIAASESPQVMVIDSIQTVYTDELSSAPGSVSQVRECAARLVNYAKQTGTAMFLVGHVTKEGALAGPRVLEHMVDTVLYFEGDSSSSYRVIRANKNRFGAVNELGVFAMTEKGLREVKNPSAIFLSRHEEPVSGSVIMVTREGSRPMLVEVQVLVDESHSPNPRRVTLGLDQNRLSMLLAVLHRHGGIAMFDQDVFVNVVGGVRVTETGIDLPVILAALSSMRNKPLPNDIIVFGEVGLSGEVRPVQAGQERLHEAAKHGFKKAIIPAANAPKKKIEGMEVIAVNRISEALDAI